MTERIKAKIAKVIDGRQLIINRGSKDGVEVGSRFAILSKMNVKITDPENPKAVIGTLPIARTIVKVTSVGDRISIARTFRTLKSSGILPPFGPREWSDLIDTDESTVVDEIGTAERTVKLGDEAVEIPGNEDFDGVVLPF